MVAGAVCVRRTTPMHITARRPPPPLVRRLGADPQQPGYLHRVDVLLKHLRGLQPQLLSAGPSLSGQAATIRVPHVSGVDPPATQFTQARRL